MNIFLKFFISYVFINCFIENLTAQVDSNLISKPDSANSNAKKWLDKLYKSIQLDTNSINNSPKPLRNDFRFQKYKGKVIRSIEAQQMDFGIPIIDSGKNVKNKLTRIANQLHHNSTPSNIKKNLFFNVNDRLEPYLLADNERYLRDLSFIRDAKIIVIPVDNQVDSVDIIVLTKDVFSLGINIQNLSLGNSQVAFTEDNLGGWGNRITIRSLYENNRANRFGHGVEYLHRNFEGTFIDGYLGYFNAANSITDKHQENVYYAKMIKPLVNPYVKWIYTVELALHSTKDMYSIDSIYKLKEQYHYYNVDSWVGLNFDGQHLSKFSESQRLRALVSLRFFNQVFQKVPLAFNLKYDFHFADVTAFLGSLSVFRQDFFKTQYFYGFGRNEDVPEGINISFTGGYTKIDNRRRPYLALDFGRYYFTHSGRYVNYVFRIGSFFYRSHFEDINALGDISYYTKILNLGSGWKQRSFIETAISKQINYLLIEPLNLQSSFGIPEFSNGNIGGNFRATFKAESVFYSPFSIAAFRLAPFIFANSTLFTPVEKKFTDSKLYNSIGGGLRTRNESLIFGTLEFKAFYFPQKNLYNKRLRFEFSSNLKFKYNSIFVRKPDFINLN